MIGNPALAHLLDMGIPGGRARAALRRTRGDVVSAADHVFSGEFDDIPSEDEGGDHEDGGSGSKLTFDGRSTPEERSASTQPLTDRARRSIVLADDGMIDSDEDGSDGLGDYADSFLIDDELAEERLLSDPYAGIFFSKDRTEQVVEDVENPEWVDAPVPPGTAGDAEIFARSRVLSLSDWMKGCPEGNEQTLLFQLYNYLGSPLKCSSGCGHQFDRKHSAFFVLLADFPSYIAHLANVIRSVCPSCQEVTCLACGESVKSTSTSTDIHELSRPRSGKMKAKETLDRELELLLHCLNVQGVILGVGLYMIEQAFQQKGTVGGINRSSSTGSPKSKRQKTHLSKMQRAISKMKASTIPEVSIVSDSDDDDDMFDLDSITSHYMGSGGGTTSARGTGYDGRVNEDRSGQMAAERAQGKKDKQTAQLLAEVRIYLPSLNRASGTRNSDHMVHPVTLAHLRRRSGFVHDLLRNDSLLDMSKRSDLYSSLFDWLRVISSHESLASILAMPQMRPVKIEPANDCPKVALKQVLVTYSGASSPRELLENCCIQAQAALKGLEATAVRQDPDMEQEDEEEMKRLSTRDLARRKARRREEENGDENIQLKEFCNRIVASAQHIDKSLAETKGRPFVERMRETLPSLTTPGKHVEERNMAAEDDDVVIKIYEQWATKARFQYCDMSGSATSQDIGKVPFKHAYNDHLQAIYNIDAPKRSLAIAKELAILTTSLPATWHSSIFLRVDETRVDCLKAMIVGPEGTPYENGCFIFHIFLPLDYNFKSPLVKSMTTNGGRYRIGPNLYVDGKVCLSLLGTWSGPGWISGQSTLLQVLISIQSLIFCEEPYLNEPGWANSGGTNESKKYSANVRRMTMIDAMGNNIRNPPETFENEVRTHFRLKARSIRTQLDRWKELDDGGAVSGAHYGHSSTVGGAAISSQTVFDKAAADLRTLLDRLEGTGKSETSSIRVTRSGARKAGGIIDLGLRLGLSTPPCK